MDFFQDLQSLFGKHVKISHALRRDGALVARALYIPINLIIGGLSAASEGESAEGKEERMDLRERSTRLHGHNAKIDSVLCNPLNGIP